MSELTKLGTTFKTGQTVPEDGNYQLVNDHPKPDWSRTDLSRVIGLSQGSTFPPHPDTDEPAEWRFNRVGTSAGRYNPD